MGKGARIRARHAAEAETARAEQPARRRAVARADRVKLFSRRLRHVKWAADPTPRPPAEKPAEAATEPRTAWRRPTRPDGSRIAKSAARRRTA